MRAVAHFLLASIELFLWGVAMGLMVMVVALAHLSHRVHPKSEWQTCWNHALWRWNTYGGYLAICKSEGVSFLKWFPVPHVIWLMGIPKRSKLEQYIPINRKKAKWLPWFTGYFKGRVIHFDSNHNADIEAYKRDQHDV
jgi:hypothetical protein